MVRRHAASSSNLLRFRTPWISVAQWLLARSAVPARHGSGYDTPSLGTASVWTNERRYRGQEHFADLRGAHCISPCFLLFETTQSSASLSSYHEGVRKSRSNRSTHVQPTKHSHRQPPIPIAHNRRREEKAAKVDHHKPELGLLVLGPLFSALALLPLAPPARLPALGAIGRTHTARARSPTTPPPPPSPLTDSDILFSKVLVRRVQCTFLARVRIR